MKQPKQVFSYYGAKSKIAKHYPEPDHDIIIEPFAGSAAYAQRYWDRKVILVDAYVKIVETWRYLISASRADILALPDISDHTPIKSFDIPAGAKYLLGFSANQGSASPKQTAKRSNWNTSGREAVADVVHHFDHWKIHHGSYSDPDIENSDMCATWYVDPPYQYGGEYYVHSNIDYARLDRFCRSRQGQTIVCENTKADWMPFKPLIEIQGMRHKTTEAIWTSSC